MDTTATYEILISILFCVVMSEFRCPRQLRTTGCTCKQEIWWNNEIRTIVNCSTANLETVPDFKDIKNYEITHLILSNNNISEISLHDFTDIVIRKMDLSANPIVQFNADFTSPLPAQLGSLIMKKNKISIDTGLHFFKGLENLTELVLDYNMLENESQSLPDNIFRDLSLSSLKQLSLQSCEIGDISANAFAGLGSLEELDLSYNYLEDIPFAIRKISRLRKLILLGNNIMHLKANSFQGLYNLQDLNLNVNEISEINDDAFIGIENSLKDVRLHYNNLNNIPSGALVKLKLLSFLVLSRNNIQFISKQAFVGFDNLKILELDSNNLVYYKEMFAGLENTLETLTLRETGLDALPVPSLLSLRRLTDLDVSRNRIKSLLRGDIGYLKLKTIDLSHNYLTEIQTEAFTGISRTIGLDLDNNRLKNISFVLKITPCAFSYIDVSGNDIICDCDTEQIINSGIVLGVGPTGHCKIDDDPSQKVYKLGTSALTKELIDRCNQTERVFDCQNMDLQPNRAITFFIDVFSVFFSVVLCYLVSKNG